MLGSFLSLPLHGRLFTGSLGTAHMLRRGVHLPWPAAWTRGGVEDMAKIDSAYTCIFSVSGDIVHNRPKHTRVRKGRTSGSLICFLGVWGCFCFMPAAPVREA